MTTFLRLKRQSKFSWKTLETVDISTSTSDDPNKCNCVVSNIYCRVDAIFRERAWRGIMARTKENFEATMEQKRVSFVKEIPLKSRHGVTELRK